MPRSKTNPDHGPTIKDDKLYQDLRDEGASKEKAARIANAAADDRRKPFKKGGQHPPYEEWTRDELYDRAKDLGIEGRSDMNKSELIGALRSR